MTKFFQIAIDGPVGAGKSSVAWVLADRLQILYVDTGAMYRAVALAAKKLGVSWEDEEGLCKLILSVSLTLEPPLGNKNDGRKVTVILDGEDVSWKIRETDFGEGASVIGQYPKVRELLVKQQQQISKGKSVVMEGRDIATRVLPEANLKIFMTADLVERVKRKKKQLLAMGEVVSEEEIRKDIASRDTREMNRKIDPLKPTQNAWVLDTSGLSVEEVVKVIKDRIALLSNSQ